MQVTVRFCLFPSQFGGRTLWEWSGASQLSSPSANHTRGCHEGTVHLQTSMTSPRLESRPYGTAGYSNSRRAASPLVWLVEGVERWEANDHARCPPSKLGWKRATSYCHLSDAQSYG
ncbi:hypothetical protein TNCV_404491 [Trichonephila clavipes]|nr:hypothetical protein TNCV_404491 [Trichonephila clavipes]